MGGKSRLAKQIVTEILKHYRKGQPYLEPFVGGANILECIRPQLKGVVLASDFCEDLSLLYTALQNGWVPPPYVSKAEYLQLKVAAASPLRGMVRTGLSFSRKPWGGYSNDPAKRRDYCGETSRALERLRHCIDGVVFSHCSYDAWNVEGYLIYCDPPYAMTTGYGNKFDNEKFWNWAREQSKRNTVIVSEYVAPDDFDCIAEFQTRLSLRSNNVSLPRVERLFRIGQQSSTINL